MTKKAKQDHSSAAGQLSDLMAQWQKMGLGAMSMMGAPKMEALTEMGSEWLHFISERVNADVDFQHKLLSAKSAEDIRNAQSEFFQKAVDDYSVETTRIAALGEKLLDPAS